MSKGAVSSRARARPPAAPVRHDVAVVNAGQAPLLEPQLPASAEQPATSAVVAGMAEQQETAAGPVAGLPEQRAAPAAPTAGVPERQFPSTSSADPTVEDMHEAVAKVIGHFTGWSQLLKPLPPCLRLTCPAS